MPHRERVVGVAVGEVRGLVRFEVEEPDVRVHPAAIPLPRAELAAPHGEGQGLAVGGDGAELGVGDGQLLGQPTVGADPVELVEPLPPALARRREEDVAVRGPVHDAVVHRVVRQPRRVAAARGDDVDVGVAVVVGAEGDVLAVGREPGEQLLAARGREPLRRAAGFRGDPHVARVDERDVGLRDVRVAEHPGVHLGVDDRGEDSEGEGESEEAEHGRHGESSAAGGRRGRLGTDGNRWDEVTRLDLSGAPFIGWSPSRHRPPCRSSRPPATSRRSASRIPTSRRSSPAVSAASMGRRTNANGSRRRTATSSISTGRASEPDVS